jgi:hypothetical protein
MAFTYPENDYDRVDAVMSVVGSFWSNVYSDEGSVRQLAYAKAQLAAQSHLKLLELVASVSRQTVPVFHTENWHLLMLRESDRNTGNAAMLKFGGDATFSGSTEYKFGEPVGLAQSAWDLPADLKDAKVLMNRIASPSLTLINGVDYLIDNGSIIFRDNPFENPLVPVRDLFEAGEIVDREIGLWVFRGSFDYATAYRQFGYVLGIHLQSSEAYRDLLNAIFDALVGGTSVRNVRQAFSALTGVPLIRETTETVEQILQEETRQLVITDQHVYQFRLSATVTVAVGDELHAGDPMTDALTFHEFNRGQVPDVDQVRQLALGRGFILSGYFQDIVFPNKDVDLVLETDADGYVKLSWELGGWPGDVAKFFDDLHERGVAAGQTLAHLLDRRVNKEGEPGPGDLPATINPLKFLCQHVLRSNTFLVRIKVQDTGEDALGLDSAKVLRKIVPPQTAMLVLVELAHVDSAIIMEAAGTADAPGYTEAVTTFSAMETSDTIDPSMVTERVSLKRITGRCQ